MNMRLSLLLLVVTVLPLTASPSGAQAAIYKEVPADHWSYETLENVMKAVGYEVYSDYSQLSCITRFEMAMQIARVYGELSKPWIRDEFTRNSSLQLLMLSAEYSAELSSFIAYYDINFGLRDRILWLTKERALKVPSSEDITEHSLIQSVPFGSWVYSAADSFVEAGILEAYPIYKAGHGGYSERAFTRYEFAMVTGRIFTKVEGNFFRDKMTNELMLKLLVLTSEFLVEMNEIGIDPKTPMLALLSEKLFVPQQMNGG